MTMCAYARLKLRGTLQSVLRRAVLVTLVVLSWPAVSLSAHTQPPEQRERERERDRRDRDDADDPSRAELKKRFEARAREVNGLKAQGFVGETFEGYLAALDERLLSKAARQLLDDENEDRKALYDAIAQRVEAGEKQVPARGVAQRNGRRNFEKADGQHYLRNSEHHWFLKRDEGRAERISRLKEDGVIGETFSGDIEAIDRVGDDEMRRVIEQENSDRRDLYQRIARQIDKTTVEQVARRMAQDMQAHLPAGHAFKNKDGRWERKSERQR